MTERDLATELVAHLADVGENTALGCARAIHARTADVLTILRRDERFSGPLTGKKGRLYYRLAPAAIRRSASFPCFSRPVSLRDGTDCARLYDALADGDWHSSSDLQGLRMTVHSRISDLRLRHGCTIETMHDPSEQRARAYLYRLVATSQPLAEREADVPAASPSASGSPFTQPGGPNGSSSASGDSRDGNSEPLQLTIGQAA